MSNLSYEKPLSEIFQTWQSMLGSANAAANILAGMAEDIRKVQSDAATAWFTDTVSSAAPSFAPEDLVHALWRIPTLYHTQARRMVNALLDTGSALARGQQALREWEVEIHSGNIERTTQAMSGLVGALASRRVTADVINFADRRARSASEATRAHDRPVSRMAQG